MPPTPDRPPEPRRTQPLATAAAAQTGWILAGTLVAGFGHTFALLLSGRTVTTWDALAAAGAAAVTGLTGVVVTTRMTRAGDRAVFRARAVALRRPAPTSTQALPAVTREAMDERAAMQGRVDRARPARAPQHEIGRARS